MTFSETLWLVAGLLAFEKRVTYERLRFEFKLDADTLEQLRRELIVAKRLAVDENGKVLVWAGGPESVLVPSTETQTPVLEQLNPVKAQLPTPIASAGTSPSRAAPPEAPKTTDAERRQLTVMFCDLVGSTALSTQMDPEDLRDVITSFQDECREAIKRYDGFIARYMGDGMLVYFGYPQAHENDAERATRAGLDIIGSMATLNAQVGKTHGVVLAVRVGVATGPVIVGDMIGEGAAEEAAVVGETPNLAARLQSVALPNQLVISHSTHHIIGDLFTFDDLGTHELKGISEPTQAWWVTAAADIESRHEIRRQIGSSPLVGRQEELGLLLRAWESCKDRHGQVVLIQGEAGVGKSRLLEGLREPLADEDYVWASVRCSPYFANTPLYPVIEHLKRVTKWLPEDDDQSRLVKLEAVLRTQSLPLEEVVPLFADLLSLSPPSDRYPPSAMTPQQKRDATLDALVGWLLELAENKPVLQVWEDLHWADATTLELLGLYIEQSHTASMLNVLTYRPEFAPPWSMQSHMTPITLNRLERPEVEALIGHRAHGKALPSEVIEHIVAKADGVPLYVEELTETILGSDFMKEGTDNYILAGSLSDVSIPTTLRDALMARLDRLPALREIAQLGSVLGREFAFELLQHLAPLEGPELQTRLAQLVENELLYQRGRPPRSRYIFKHALVQDAAYQSLLNRTRQTHHRQVAELLESQYSKIVLAQPELVAHHYSQAGQSDKAVTYLMRSAEQSAAMYAHAEAVTALGQALVHAEQLPASERDHQLLNLALRQVESLHFLGRRQEIVDLLVLHQERLEQLGDPSIAGQYYFWLGFAHAWLGHRLEADRDLRLGLEAAICAGDEVIRGKIHRALATECVYSGRPLDEAVAHGREAVSLLERTEDHIWLSQALFTLGYCCIFAGNFDAALEATTHLDAIGKTHGIRRSQSNAAMIAGLSRAFLGEGEAAVTLCEQALELSPDTFETAFVLACLGRARWEAGDFAGAVSALEEAVQLADRVRSLQFRQYFRTMLGEAYLLHGEIDKASGVVCEALEVSMNIQFLVGVGLSTHLLGRIAQVRGELTAAVQHLDEALRTFTLLGARFEMGRTLLDLAELAHSQGKCEAVEVHLKEAHALFTSLQVPKQIEQTSQLSKQFEVSLMEAPAQCVERA